MGDVGDREEMAREGMEASGIGGWGGGPRTGVEVQGTIPVEVKGSFRSWGGPTPLRRTDTGVTMKVKNLSRLWLYRNGRSPNETPALLGRDADGMVRNATL